MDRNTFERALMDGGLEMLQTTGDLATCLPEVQAIVGFGGSGTQHKDLWWHTKLVVQQCDPIVPVRWAALFHDVGKPPTFKADTGKVTFHGHEALSAKLFNQAAQRTGWFSGDERRYIRFLVRNLGQVEGYQSDWTDAAVRRLYKLAGDHFSDLLVLARADVTTKHDNKRAQHHERVDGLKERALALAKADAVPAALPKGLGSVLMVELGLEPGPGLGALMGRLKAAVEAGKLPRSDEQPPQGYRDDPTKKYDVYVEFARNL